jgi:hypothetical protein
VLTPNPAPALNTLTGATTVQSSLKVNPASNSTATLDVKYAGGTESILTVDTTNEKVYVMGKASGNNYGTITTQDNNSATVNTQSLLIKAVTPSVMVRVQEIRELLVW